MLKSINEFSFHEKNCICFVKTNSKLHRLQKKKNDKNPNKFHLSDDKGDKFVSSSAP